MALTRPAREAPVHGVCLEAGRAERLGGHRRARADTAVEDDHAPLLDLLGARGELYELDVAAAGDVAGLALVGFAHVDELQGGVPTEPFGHARGLDVEALGAVVGAHGMSLAPSR